MGFVQKFNQCVFIVFIMFSWSLQAQLTQNEDFVDELYSELNNQAIKLNALIKRYQLDNELEISEQENFANILMDFKNDMQQLDEQGVDVSEYEENYVEQYEDWASVMISESSLLEEIANAGKPVPHDSKEIVMMTQLYKSLQTSILQNQKQFDTQIRVKLNNLGTYSVQSQKNFLKSLHNEFNAFYLAMQSVKTATKNAYFNFLMDEDSTFNPQDLTEQDKQFLRGIDTMIQNAIDCQRVFMLNVTSKQLEINRIKNLQKDLKNVQLLDDQAYQAQLKINEEGLQLSWWQELINYGQDFMQNFSQEFQKEVAIQTNKAILDVGGKIAGEVGRGVIKPIAEGLSSQISKFGITVKTESVENFFKDLSPAARAVKSVIRIANPIVTPSKDVVVKTDIALSLAEKQAATNRMKRIKPILKQEFGIDQPLRMAFCCSGGGVRAMVGTMGIFKAAARAKILQSCLYMAGLSGSTWMIAPWSYLYLQNKLKKDYSESLQQMVDNWKIVLNDPNMVKVGSKVHTPANLTGKQASKFSLQVAVRLAYGAPITAVDIYGAMVGNFALHLAGDDRLTVEWSDVAQQLVNGELPLPLCSAVFNGVLPEDRLTKNEYEWCEISPFEVGGTQIGYIPPQYLGSSFIENKLDTSIGQLRPAYPLAYVLGVCGSAFAINLNDVINKAVPNMIFKVENQKITLPIDMWVRSTLDETFGKKGRFKRGDSLYALFANYSVDNKDSVLYRQDMFELVDGGIAFNVPLPLLLDRPERAVDLIIMYDSNPVDVEIFTEATKYYQKHSSIPVPDMSKVTTESLQSKVMTVFNDPRDVKYDKEKPTFLYFPTMVNISKLPYITTNFKYSSKDTEKLIDKTDASFTSQLDDIKIIMKLVAKYRHG